MIKFKNIFSFLKPKVEYKYFFVDACYRAVYHQNTMGGALITIRFEKTVKRFGKIKKYSEIVTFNNYHSRDKDKFGERLFTYNPPYIPGENAHSEDSIWHSILVWKECENYPFAPINTRQLNIWFDDWEKTVTSTSCPYCNYKQTTDKKNKVIKCKSCNRDFGVPE